MHILHQPTCRITSLGVGPDIHCIVVSCLTASSPVTPVSPFLPLLSCIVPLPIQYKQQRTTMAIATSHSLTRPWTYSEADVSLYDAPLLSVEAVFCSEAYMNKIVFICPSPARLQHCYLLPCRQPLHHSVLPNPFQYMYQGMPPCAGLLAMPKRTPDSPLLRLYFFCTYP